MRVDALHAIARVVHRESTDPVGGETLVATSVGMRRVLEQVRAVAPLRATVLIAGETGVGKELVARAIYQSSARSCGHALVKVNCSAIPPELFESEFFGHVKGAFTGAVRDQTGRFPLADGGTLFLDEISDLPLAMQPKLLRILDDGEYEPIGCDQTRRADVRVIAATNRDLGKEVRAGRFREDLYYRLSVFPIEVPPLRERKDGIGALARHFLRAACAQYNRTDLSLSAGVLRQLEDYDWPGNVRELRHVIERAVIAARNGDLPIEIGAAMRAAHAPAASDQASSVVSDAEMKRRERDNVAAALKRSGGRIYGPGGAAELLGVRPTTLCARIKKLGLKHAP